MWPDPVEGEYKSGKSTLIPILESHYPIDLVVLLLGTNDLKHRFGLSAYDIAAGAGTLVEMIQATAFGPDGRPPLVLLVSPPPTCVRGTRFDDMFDGADETSTGLDRHYSLVADEFGCGFLERENTSRLSQRSTVFTWTRPSCPSSAVRSRPKSARCCLERGRPAPRLHALVRPPGDSFASAISSTGAQIDVRLAQHSTPPTAQALVEAGVAVEALASRRALSRQLLYAGPGAGHRR